MLDPEELDKLIDEYSLDSYPKSEENQKLRAENEKLRDHIKKFKSTAIEVLTNYRCERQKTIQLEETLKLERERHEFLNNDYQNLRHQYQEIERRSVNEIFHLKQIIDELNEKHAEEHTNHIQLSKDYFTLLSDATCFHNYVIKKPQNAIITKTERFLYDCFKGEYKKPKILRSKLSNDDDNVSIISTRSKRRSAAKSEPTTKKKAKTDISEFQSISQVSSPMNLSCFDDDASSFSVYPDSGISLDTTFSPQTKLSSTICSCSSPDNLPKLVSTGTNTEIFEELPSVPLLTESEEIDTMSETIESSLGYSSQSKEIETNDEEIDYESMINIPEIPTQLIEKVTKETSTSTDALETSDKSVNTIHSTTTRGTSTLKVTTKNFSMQFPEVSLDKIFDEFSFELPDCISPIEFNEELMEVTECVKSSTCCGTITELNNVNREIDYVCNQPLKIKIEKSAFDDNRVEMDEHSFMVLGKTIFNLMLQKMQQSSELNNELMREEIWEKINRQLVEKGSNIDISFTESEKSSEGDRETEVIKDNLELPKVISSVDDIEVEPNILNNDYSNEIDCETIESLNDEEIVTEHELLNDIEVSEEENGSNIELETKVDSTSAKSENSENSQEFDEILKDIMFLESTSPSCLSPLDDIFDTIWGSIFPKTDDMSVDFDSPSSPLNILEDYDFECESLEIPMEAEIVYTENDTPKSPPPFICEQTIDPVIIPSTSNLLNIDASTFITYDTKMRQKIMRWNTRSLCPPKVISQMRNSIENYLLGEWNSENIEICMASLVDKKQNFMVKTIFEIVENYSKFDVEISMEFTPPAPALPRYLQKLILIIDKLTQKNYPTLPKYLIEDLEERLFKCQKVKDMKFNHEDLRNFAYYYSSLVDLFCEGNTSMVFYFIVKSIYFFEQDAVPLIFVLIKAFPMCLVKKSQLLKKTSPEIDWENMSGLEISKVQLNHDNIDSLDLTIMFILTFPKIYEKFENMQSHELFNFVPRFYGFYKEFMCEKKLLLKLMKRLEEGQLDNISLSFIIFAKIMRSYYTIETLVKGNLIPFLTRLSQLHQLNAMQSNQICVLLETISSILKAFSGEKEKSIKMILSNAIEIYGRFENIKVRESCLKALLRLQKFSGNHKEIFSMLKHHVENHKSCMSENLYSAIETFIYRKNETSFFELNST